MIWKEKPVEDIKLSKEKKLFEEEKPAKNEKTVLKRCCTECYASAYTARIIKGLKKVKLDLENCNL